MKVTESARPMVAMGAEKKLSVPNIVNSPSAPPPVPPHEPLNGDARRHRKHRRPTSSSPTRHIVQSPSAVLSPLQRIPNGRFT